jgi:hypothetical protein
VSVVTVAEYRALTGSAAGTDAAVQAALDETEALVAEYLRRPLAEAERTETLVVRADGTVWPSATPVESVSEPAGAAVQGGTLIEVGGTAFGPYFVTEGPWPGAKATVTYVGGWSSATLPATVRRAIVTAAKAALEGDTLALAARGPVTAEAVGDVSRSYAAPVGGGGSALPAGVVQGLRWYRRD